MKPLLGPRTGGVTIETATATTNLGPLTTTFTPPASCTASTAQIYQIWSSLAHSYVQRPLPDYEPDCFPSGYKPSVLQYYSPGVCPGGYTAACSASKTAGTVTETTHICCPTQLSYTCRTTSDASSHTYLGCVTTYWPPWSTSIVSRVLGVAMLGIFDRDLEGRDATRVTESASGYIEASSIQVRMQATDSFPTVTSTTAATPSSSTTNSTTQTSGPMQTGTSVPPFYTTTASIRLATTAVVESSISDSPGIGPGVIAGIALGTAACALCLVSLCVVFCILRRRRKRGIQRRRKSPPLNLNKPLPSPKRPLLHVCPPYELEDDTPPRKASRRAAEKGLGIFILRKDELPAELEAVVTPTPTMRQTPGGRGFVDTPMQTPGSGTDWMSPKRGLPRWSPWM